MPPQIEILFFKKSALKCISNKSIANNHQQSITTYCMVSLVSKSRAPLPTYLQTHANTLFFKCHSILLTLGMHSLLLLMHCNHVLDRGSLFLQRQFRTTIEIQLRNDLNVPVIMH